MGEPVRAAAPWGTNINTASPGATIDGVTMVAGDRVLLPYQTTGNQNGVWIWNGAAVAMTRSVGNADDLFSIGAFITVLDGTEQAGKVFQNKNDTAVIVGTTHQYWSQIFPGINKYNPPPGGTLLPKGTLYTTGDRTDYQASHSPATGQIYVPDSINVAAGVPIKGVSFILGGTAVGTPTRQWAGIADAEGVAGSARAILAISADKTNVAWANNTEKRFDFAAGVYIPPKDMTVHIFININATTMPSFPARTGVQVNLLGAVAAAAGGVGAGARAGTSTGSQTTPPAVGTVLTAITGNHPFLAMLYG
jgi:hypothetical protein